MSESESDRMTRTRFLLFTGGIARETRRGSVHDPLGTGEGGEGRAGKGGEPGRASGPATPERSDDPQSHILCLRGGRADGMCNLQ